MIGSLIFSNQLLRWRIGRAVAYSFSNLTLLFLICVAVKAAIVREQWLHMPPELLILRETQSTVSTEPTSSIAEVYAFRAQCIAMCICMAMVALKAIGSLYQLWHRRLRARDVALGVLPISRPQYIVALYDAPLILRTVVLMVLLSTLLVPDRGLQFWVHGLFSKSPIEWLSLELLAGSLMLIAVATVLYLYRAIQFMILIPSKRLLLRVAIYPALSVFITLLADVAFESQWGLFWGLGYVLPIIAIAASWLALHPRCPFWHREW